MGTHRVDRGPITTADIDNLPRCSEDTSGLYVDYSVALQARGHAATSSAHVALDRLAAATRMKTEKAGSGWQRAAASAPYALGYTGIAAYYGARLYAEGYNHLVLPGQPFSYPYASTVAGLVGVVPWLLLAVYSLPWVVTTSPSATPAAREAMADTLASVHVASHYTRLLIRLRRHAYSGDCADCERNAVFCKRWRRGTWEHARIRLKSLYDNAGIYSQMSKIIGYSWFVPLYITTHPSPTVVWGFMLLSLLSSLAVSLLVFAVPGMSAAACFAILLSVPVAVFALALVTTRTVKLGWNGSHMRGSLLASVASVAVTLTLFALLMGTISGQLTQVPGARNVTATVVTTAGDRYEGQLISTWVSDDVFIARGDGLVRIPTSAIASLATTSTDAEFSPADLMRRP